MREEAKSLRQEKDSSATDESRINLTPTSVVQVSSIYPMNQRKLAERLGLKSHTYLSVKKLEPGFLEWSRERDRDRIGWRFDSASKLFYSVD